MLVVAAVVELTTYPSNAMVVQVVQVAVVKEHTKAVMVALLQEILVAVAAALLMMLMVTVYTKAVMGVVVLQLFRMLDKLLRLLVAILILFLLVIPLRIFFTLLAHSEPTNYG